MNLCCRKSGSFVNCLGEASLGVVFLSEADADPPQSSKQSSHDRSDGDNHTAGNHAQKGGGVLCEGLGPPTSRWQVVEQLDSKSSELPITCSMYLQNGVSKRWWTST